MRSKCVVCLVVFAAVMAAGSLAHAQERSKVGVNLGYPLVGLTWHLTENMAVRPEFTFSFGSSSSTSGSGVEGSETDAWGIGFGASALFYVLEWEDVRGYVAPRFGYTRSHTEGLSTTSSSKFETASNAYQLAAMVGAQCAVNRRFTVFGEIGLSYNKQHGESKPLGVLNLETDSWSLGPRTAIGAILYF